MRHRHEAAGLVTTAVALVWISLGIAARAWAPCLVGVTFALGAFVIGTQAVWVSD
jgi:predicted Kef-type K+ transport protein